MARWLKRLWPSSLASQLMLVTALSLLFAQGVNFVLLVGAQQRERTAAIAAGAATQIADASDRLDLGGPVPPRWLPRVFADSEERAAADALPPLPAGDRGRRSPHGDGSRGDGPRRGRLTVDSRPHIPPHLRAEPHLAQATRDFLADAGMEVRAVRAASGQPRRNARQLRGDPLLNTMVAVAAQRNDGRWITVRSRVRGPRPIIGSLLLVQTGILLLLLLGPLLWMAWRVTRPLARLAAVAGDMRPGMAAPPEPESGPEDVRSLTRAFNGMRERILRLLEDKDRMLGAVGHDLRTPLASLRVRAELVADETLRARMVATIEDMAGMLDDILTLASAGQPRETAVPTDLAGLIGDVVGDYAAMGRPVTLAEEGAVVTRTLRASGLRRALRNLIDNAVTYGGGAVVGLSQQADGTLCLTVDDHGPGIAPERIDELMRPFARGEESRNRDTGGSGLGLALARAIAQAEGGDLTLSNRKTGGLRASIRWPGPPPVARA